jgi:hypothetical protein
VPIVHADAAPTSPPRLIDELRALPRTPGDRARAMALHTEALKVHRAKNFAESERIWADAARADPAWDGPYYNLACSTALQGRPDDAIAYLEMVRDREPDPGRLRRIETDRDLRSLRARDEYKALLAAIADDILARLSEPMKDEADYPDDWTGERPTGAGCGQVSFAKGRYQWDCAACCSASGTYKYRNGTIYVHLTEGGEDVLDATGEGLTRSSKRISEYGAYKFGRFAQGIVCLDQVSDPSWPGNRRIIPYAGIGGLPDGCYR